VLFILHADHEQNCGTTAMRVIGSRTPTRTRRRRARRLASTGPATAAPTSRSSRCSPRSAATTVDGGRRGRAKSGEFRLQGFGHRVYKNYDPRAKIIKDTAYEVFEITGKNPLLDIALKLEEVALSDDYFISRKLYPNVDFYSGLIYQAMGFPIEMFTVLFAIPRITGWLAHWDEMLAQNQRIARPRQVYTGEPMREYVPIASRT
jgi:citrate synthase